MGNLDELIAVRAPSLEANGCTHLSIAEELDAAGRPDEALEWAERGLRHAAAEGERPHRGLVDHHAARHTREGRPADAFTVRRDHFQSDWSLHTYHAPRTTARAVTRRYRPDSAQIALSGCLVPGHVPGRVVSSISTVQVPQSGQR